MMIMTDSHSAGFDRRGYRKLTATKIVLDILKEIEFGVQASTTIINSRRKRDAINTMTDRKLGQNFRYYRKKKLARLETEGLIVNLGGDKFQLSKEGKRLLTTCLNEEISIKRPLWDGVWHLVAYDIPNDFSRNRDALRKKLREWGFTQIQKSLWAIPYDCKEEIAVICKLYEISPWVVYLNTDRLPNETYLIARYALK